MFPASFAAVNGSRDAWDIVMNQSYFTEFPKFIALALVGYFVFRRCTNKRTLEPKSEAINIGIFTVIGYVFWTIPHLYFMLTCSRPLCAIAGIAPFMPGLIVLLPFDGFLQNGPKILGAVIFFTVNTAIVFVITVLLGRIFLKGKLPTPLK